MKICIRQAPDTMVINENHNASCWMNVKDQLDTQAAIEHAEAAVKAAAAEEGGEE